MDLLLEDFRAWMENPAAHAIIVLVGTLLVLVLVRVFISRVLSRITGRTKTDLDDKLIEAFKRPVDVAIVVGGIWYALNAWKDIPPEWSSPLHSILLTIVILAWTAGAMKFATMIIERLSQVDEYHSIVQPRTKPIFSILIQLLVILSSLYFLIQAWNLNITGWLASAGVAGLAFGFAAKDTLANLISGIFIIADAPYKIGDYIVLEDGERGRITFIGIRSTRMLTRDDVEIIIPNAVMGNTKIINQSGGPYEKFRLRVPVSVAYGSDIDLVQDVLMECGAEEATVVDDPKHRVRFRSFGDSGLEFELLVWVEKPELRGIVLDLLLIAIYKKFAANGVEIPYPKRDVYLHTVDKKKPKTNEQPQDTDEKT